MCKMLGADFGEGKAFIPNPAQSDRKIYIILDVAHMLKLFRNCIGTRNINENDTGLIQWSYITALYEAQKSQPWNLGHKLTKAHIDWKNKKMNVQLASETISVADSLEFMKNASSSEK